MTVMLRSVLVHTDVETPEAAMVAGVAKGLKALGTERVLLVSVQDTSGLEGPIITAKVEQTRGALERIGSELEAAGLEVECRVPIGEPVRELLAMCGECGVDAVLSGSHGKSSVERLFAGSVSEALAALSGVPNLVVRFERIDESGDPRALLADFAKVLVVPTDCSDAADRALDAAVDLAVRAGGRVVLVHVGEEEEAAAKLRARAERAAKAGADATFVVRPGGVADGVMAEAESHGATGIVMGTRGIGTAWGELVLGSLSLTLLRQAPCPLMIVP